MNRSSNSMSFHRIWQTLHQIQWKVNIIRWIFIEIGILYIKIFGVCIFGEYVLDQKFGGQKEKEKLFCWKFLQKVFPSSSKTFQTRGWGLKTKRLDPMERERPKLFNLGSWAPKKSKMILFLFLIIFKSWGLLFFPSFW